MCKLGIFTVKIPKSKKRNHKNSKFRKSPRFKERKSLRSLWVVCCRFVGFGLFEVNRQVDMSRKSEKEKKRSSHGDSSDSDDGEIDGMRIAADQLTLSPGFLDKVPKNIREWATKDTQAWLREIFEGSEDLER